MKRIDLALAAGIVLAVIISSFTGFARDCGETRSGVVRLHILANSDDARDQSLKLKVRDRVLIESAAVFSNSRTKPEAQESLSLQKIESAARDELMANGCDLPVKARLVNMYFERREYDNTLFPAGLYDAVRIEIGAAKGQNWWCVMFPPMCLPAASKKPESPLPVEESIRKLNEQPRYVPKLAALEFFERLTGNAENDLAPVSATAGNLAK